MTESDHGARIAARLEVIRGLRRGVDLGPRLLEVALASNSRDEALQILMSEEYGLSETQAQHVLDMRIASFTADRRGEYADIEQDLLRGELKTYGSPQAAVVMEVEARPSE